MIKVEVPWADRWDGANFSIELARWCKEQGLKDEVDFNWHYLPTARLTVFYFKGEAESYATLFQLKWAGDDR